MNKIVTVLGVAAVVAIAGCKDPDYKYAYDTSSRDAKIADPLEASQESKTAQPVEEAPKCKCVPGTKHAAPCGCGASDCACVVVQEKKPQAQPKTGPQPEQEYTLYTVQNGDYLAKISKRYNVTIGSIKRLNNLSSDTIRVGQKLKLPGKIDLGTQKAASAPTAKKTSQATTAYKGETKEYTVKSGDTLGAIAYGNGCTIRQLKSMNGLTKDTLRVGQKLKIPSNGKAVAKSETTKKPTAKATPPAASKTDAPADASVAEAPVADAPAPAADAQTTEQPAEAAQAPEAPSVTYIVQEGDDMTGICIRFNVSAAAIRELNNLPDDAQLQKGMALKLPPEAQQ